MGRKALKTLAVVLTVILACSLFPAAALATPVDEARAEQQELESQMDAINTDLMAAISRYDDARADLDETENVIAAKTDQLNACEQDLARANAILCQRAKGIYKYGDVNLLEVLFGSKSVSELTERFDLLTRIGNADAELVRSVGRTKSEIERMRAGLEQDRTKQATLLAQIEQEKSKIESQLSEKRGLLASVEDDLSRLTEPQVDESDARANSYRLIISDQSPGHGGVVDIARSLIGVPYMYGGTTPDGFDCSGFVWYCYRQSGISLNRMCDYPPTMWSYDELQPGDLVYSHGGGHVGIYSGGGMQIHAPYPGTYVQEGPISGFCGGYRP